LEALWTTISEFAFKWLDVHGYMYTSLFGTPGVLRRSMVVALHGYLERPEVNFEMFRRGFMIWISGYNEFRKKNLKFTQRREGEDGLRLSKDVSMSCGSLLCISVPIRRSQRLIIWNYQSSEISATSLSIAFQPSSRKGKIYSEINRAKYVRTSVVTSNLTLWIHWTQSSTFWIRNYES
jgi:hypothetical protein